MILKLVSSLAPDNLVSDSGESESERGVAHIVIRSFY